MTSLGPRNTCLLGPILLELHCTLPGYIEEKRSGCILLVIRYMFMSFIFDIYIKNKSCYRILKKSELLALYLLSNGQMAPENSASGTGSK